MSVILPTTILSRWKCDCVISCATSQGTRPKQLDRQIQFVTLGICITQLPGDVGWIAGHSRTCRVIYIIFRGCRAMLIGIAPGTCGPGRAQHAGTSVYTVPIAPSDRHRSGGFPLLVGQSRRFRLANHMSRIVLPCFLYVDYKVYTNTKVSRLLLINPWLSGKRLKNNCESELRVLKTTLRCQGSRGKSKLQAR